MGLLVREEVEGRREGGGGKGGEKGQTMSVVIIENSHRQNEFYHHVVPLRLGEKSESSYMRRKLFTLEV